MDCIEIFCGCCNRVLWEAWSSMTRRYRRQVQKEKPKETPPRPKRTTELVGLDTIGTEEEPLILRI